MNKSEYSTFGHLLFYFRTLVILLSSTPQRFPTNLSILRPPLSHRIVSTYTSSCQNGIAAIRPLSGYGHKRCLQDGFHGIRNDDFKPATAATKESAGQHSPVVRRTLFILLLFFNASLYALSSSSSRLVMLFKPVTMVEPLCRSAPVAGGRIPPTPSAMSSALKPMIKL